MAYNPINDDAFLAAYSGALAAMATPGLLFSDTSANYDAVTKTAGAFAQAFDTVWNSATALTTLEQRLMQTIAEANLLQHAPPNQTSLQLAAAWTITAAAIKALVLQSAIYFVAQGIPQDAGSGGGTTVQVSETGDSNFQSLTTTSGVIEIGHMVGLTILNVNNKFDIDFQCVAGAIAQGTAYGATMLMTLQARRNGGGWQMVNTAQYVITNSIPFFTPYIAKTTDQALALAGLAAGDLVETRVIGQVTSDGGVAGGGVLITPNESVGRANLRFIEYGV